MSLRLDHDVSERNHEGSARTPKSGFGTENAAAIGGSPEIPDSSRA